MTGAHAQKSAQLGLQQIDVPKKEPDAAFGQGRVPRRRERKVREDLVAAQIHQTENELSRMHPLRRALEELELLVLGRKSVADGKGEFGPVEADPVSLVEQRRFGIGELVDVRQQWKRRAVERDGREIDEVPQPFLRGLQIRRQAIVLAFDGAFRIDEDDAGHGVDDEAVARLDLRQGGRHAGHSRRPERPREDRAVGELVASHGHERAHIVELEARRHRGQELVGDDDRAGRDLRPGGPRSRGQGGEQPPAHVVDVRCPSP